MALKNNKKSNTKKNNRKSKRISSSSMIAKKTFKNNTLNSSKKLYQDILNVFMQMLTTIKLYHWKTSNYSTHKATDQLYSDLNDKIDNFVEVLLGKNIATGVMRSYILNVKTIKPTIFRDNNQLKREIESYKSFLINFTNQPQMKQNSNSDLLNIRDEILAVLNQFLYLLSLH